MSRYGEVYEVKKFDVPYLESVMNEEEHEFVITQYDGDHKEFLRVHPWDRKYNDGNHRQVFIATGENEDDFDKFHSIVVDRDAFVDMLRAVFPELGCAR